MRTCRHAMVGKCSSTGSCPRWDDRRDRQWSASATSGVAFAEKQKLPRQPRRFPRHGQGG
jgi:hypothetical protein